MDRTVSNILQLIIPKQTYEFRVDFDNKDIIDGLNAEEFSMVEDELISMLYSGSTDPLVSDTLVYMRSTNSIDALRFCFQRSKKALHKLHCATNLWLLTKEEAMVDAAREQFWRVWKTGCLWRSWRRIDIGTCIMWLSRMWYRCLIVCKQIVIVNINTWPARLLNG